MASTAFPVLAPLETPRAANERPFPVHFRHPAYPENAPPLLALFAANGVLDYDLALVCCCILAATNWDKGYLAVRQQGLVFNRTQRPSDGLLRGREYFFCLEDAAVSVPQVTPGCAFEAQCDGVARFVHKAWVVTKGLINVVFAAELTTGVICL
ncbi:hypothetical protein OOU_Y34scaffold00838g1, partial [Pyricularia oryzae Y34]